MVFNDELRKLYSDIRNCNICSEMYREKALRSTQAVNPNSDVFIICQAPAKQQVIKTGVQFFELQEKSGRNTVKLSSTGERLEAFLNKFERTLYPPQDIQVSNNLVIPKCKPGHLSVYSSDIVQCHPPGNRVPWQYEISGCISKGYLTKEIALMGPKLLLLMGKLSRDIVFRDFLDEKPSRNLSSHMSDIIEAGKIPRYKLNKRTVFILPIYHASGQRRNQFNTMANNEQIIRFIREALRIT